MFLEQIERRLEKKMQDKLKPKVVGAKVGPSLYSKLAELKGKYGISIKGALVLAATMGADAALRRDMTSTEAERHADNASVL